jgi:gliding motility-associated-like protein
MKKISFYIVLSFVLSLSLNAQINLVPNPSFEIYDTCPYGLSYLTPSCQDWFTPTSVMTIIPPQPFSLFDWGSSDYFNICSFHHTSLIPNNFVGYQLSKSGQAYAGFLLLNNFLNYSIFDYKEYIEVRLINSLELNKKYCVNFYYSIAEFGGDSAYNSIDLSILLTNFVVKRQSGVGTFQPQNIYDTPQISQKLPETKDTLNWIKVSGSFIAQGGEQYLTIGNFQHTDTLTDKNVYVYIDDVSVYYCGLDTTLLPIDSLIIPNVFTPNGDGTNDRFEYKNQEQWEFETLIFNRWEVPVYHNKTSKNWDGTFEGNNVSSGVYFYNIKARAIQSGKEVNYRGTVTVMY